MNNVCIIGNITRDLDLRVTQSGKSVTNFTVAVTNDFNREETYFFDVVVWGKTAEVCATYLHKGSKVGIAGRLTTRTWETQEGQKRKVTEIVGDKVDFLTPKGEAAPKTQDDEWNNLGKEINLKDVEISGDDSELPF